MKKRSKFIFLLALTWSLGHVQAQVSYNGCSNDTTKNSSAIGFRSESRGECSFASGNSTVAEGNYSFAAGNFTWANMNNSFVFGSGVNKGFTPSYLLSPAKNSFYVGFEKKTVFYAVLDSALSHRVGIGTTAPKTELDVLGTTRTEKLRVVNNTIEYTGGNLGFYPKNESSGGLDPGSEVLLVSTLFLKDNGVGILTDNPKQGMALDVNGSVNFKNVYANTLTFTGSSANNITFEGASMNIFKIHGGKESTPGGGGGGVLDFRTLMTLAETGNVGIGTTSPKETLDVGGNMRADTVKVKHSIFMEEDMLTFTFMGESGQEQDTIVVFDNSGKGKSEITKLMTMKRVKNYDNSITGRLGVGTDNPQSLFHVNGLARSSSLQIDGDSYFIGNVGIGVSKPTKKLHVQGDSYFNGKIGIGKDNPQYPLDVNGDGNFSSIHTNDIYFPGTEMRIRTAGIQSRELEDESKDGSGDESTDGGDPEGGMNTYIDVMTFKKNGNVGISTPNPTQKLHVSGTTYLNGDTHISGNLGVGTTNPTKPLHVKGDGYITGSLGIGTTDMGGFKLKVSGKINCSEVVVTAPGSQSGDGDGGEWPDNVFSDDYQLRSLDELSSYIQENQRLPEIPSAAEVAENGVNLLQINTLLLKKVEELTLYILQQNEQILQQNEQMTDLQKQINQLKK